MYARKSFRMRQQFAISCVVCGCQVLSACRGRGVGVCRGCSGCTALIDAEVIGRQDQQDKWNTWLANLNATKPRNTNWLQPAGYVMWVYFEYLMDYRKINREYTYKYRFNQSPALINLLISYLINWFGSCPATPSLLH